MMYDNDGCRVRIEKKDDIRGGVAKRRVFICKIMSPEKSKSEVERRRRLLYIGEGLDRGTKRSCGDGRGDGSAPGGEGSGGVFYNLCTRYIYIYK